MQVCTDPARNSPVPPLPAILGAVQDKLNALKDRWSAQLGQDPSRFGQVEVEVHRAFQESGRSTWISAASSPGCPQSPRRAPSSPVAPAPPAGTASPWSPPSPRAAGGCSGTAAPRSAPSSVADSGHRRARCSPPGRARPGRGPRPTAPSPAAPGSAPFATRRPRQCRSRVGPGRENQRGRENGGVGLALPRFQTAMLDRHHPFVGGVGRSLPGAVFPRNCQGLLRKNADISALGNDRPTPPDVRHQRRDVVSGIGDLKAAAWPVGELARLLDGGGGPLHLAAHGGPFPRSQRLVGLQLSQRIPQARLGLGLVV